MVSFGGFIFLRKFLDFSDITLIHIPEIYREIDDNFFYLCIFSISFYLCILKFEIFKIIKINEIVVEKFPKPNQCIIQY